MQHWNLHTRHPPLPDNALWSSPQITQIELLTRCSPARLKHTQWMRMTLCRKCSHISCFGYAWTQLSVTAASVHHNPCSTPTEFHKWRACQPSWSPHNTCRLDGEIDPLSSLTRITKEWSGCRPPVWGCFRCRLHSQAASSVRTWNNKLFVHLLKDSGI